MSRGRRSRSDARRPRELAIDRAIYLVDDRSRTYRFRRRNPEWRGLDARTSLRHQRQLEGYTRIFASGKTRVFRLDAAPSRRARRERLER